MAIAAELIRDAKAGNRVKLLELAQCLNLENYTIPILNAVVTNYRHPILAQGVAPNNTSRHIFWTAAGATASLGSITDVCAQLPQSDPRRERTVETMLKQSNQIFEWLSCIFQWTPQFTPFTNEIGGTTINNVCRALNLIMKLTARLSECAVNSLSASFIALRLWTLRTPGPGATKLMIPPGTRVLEL
ncbi:hypothetical protein BKA70DRAFT_1507366 [Coprinopsis sp. MPI-PUGE-AT-0042]|nr:hypothetical protein BKA70DRAFT_1507366 [Coprinopsis sp. MPI-PUGE-AT-0042]